jgi:ribonuclease HI
LQILQCKISILEKNADSVACLVQDPLGNRCGISYAINNDEIRGDNSGALFQQVLQNHFQFKKVIRSALRGKSIPQKPIHAVFIVGFPFLEEEAFFKTIFMDQRNGEFSIEVNEKPLPAMHKIFADGSYLCKTGKSGVGGFVEFPDGKREIYSQTFTHGSSNLMELMAVIKGLEMLHGTDEIIIHTDSRFVIRGLIQWVHFWRLNNWQTSHGHEVRYVKHWQNIDELCKGKLIAFKWIKGHSGNQNQDFCHKLAKGSASKNNGE